jgi:hypothetical protein
MARYQIVCAKKDSTGITHVAILVPTKAAVRMLQDGTKLFVRDAAGHVAEVLPVDGNPPHLRTEPDGDPWNNLLALPDCPGD